MDTFPLNINFVDFSDLNNDAAKELFDVLFPHHAYSKSELPWKLCSRVVSVDIVSPKKLPPTSVNNGYQQSNTEKSRSFSENVSQPAPPQPYPPPVSTIEPAPKVQIPPPFHPSGSPRAVPPSNISQFTQQPPMAYYGRPPPFPVVTSAYAMPGQEMLALHQQQTNYCSDPSMYEMTTDNDPSMMMEHQHYQHQHHHQKYRTDKQTGYSLRKTKKNMYHDQHVYGPEDVCMSMVEHGVEGMEGQPTMGPSIVPFPTNHYTGPTGYPMQYANIYVPYMTPYPAGYMPPPGTLGGMIDVPQAPVDVVPYEPPILVQPPHTPVNQMMPPLQQPPLQPVRMSNSMVHIKQEIMTSQKEIPLPVCPVEEVVAEDLTYETEVLNDSLGDRCEVVETVEGSIKEEEDELEEEVSEREEDLSADDERTPYQSSINSTPEKPSPPEIPVKHEQLQKAEPVLALPAPSAWGAPAGKSWAALFKAPDCPVSDSISNNKVQDQLTLKLEEEEDYLTDDGESDCLQLKLGKFVQRLQLDFTTRTFQPRGLINKSNWCYINATLQALMNSPALFNMLRQLQDVVCLRANSSTPIMDSLVDFVKEFTPLNHISKRKEDLTIGPPLEPTCIHKMLSLIKSECIMGRQEDAEEFLSCILNGLHEEMVSLTKATTLNNGTCNGGLQTNGRVDGSEEEDEAEECWKVMGTKNKGMVTRSDQASGSLVKDLFGGQTRSVLTAGSECSAVLQPFFTLQLDIQGSGESVMDSLSQLTVKEPIHGYQCPKSKREVEAHRRTTLEELPPVLILHFKRFVYDDKDGGSKKLIKRTDYPLDLELKIDLLSSEVRKKYSAKHSRSYKLFAVVYHDGKEAVKGHYIADIYYPGSGSWLRCDDRNITPTTEAQVLSFNAPCVPYLLFYSRTDLQQQQAASPSSK